MPHFDTDKTLRQIPSPPKNVDNFIDFAAGGLTENEVAIIKLFYFGVKKAIKRTPDSELFNLTKTMQMMVLDEEEIARNCLENSDFGGDEKRSELAQIIQLMTIGKTQSQYDDVFKNSQHERVRKICNRLEDCNDNGKEILRNFALRFTIDLIEKNYEIFNDAEKQIWDEQVGKSPNEFYAEFHRVDQEQRGDLLRRSEEKKGQKRKLGDKKNFEETKVSRITIPENIAIIHPILPPSSSPKSTIGNNLIETEKDKTVSSYR